MKLLNALVALLLAVAAAAVALLFIGSQEQHIEMLEKHFWGTLGLRFFFASAVGLVGVALWWGVNGVLLKIGVVQNISFCQTALLAIAGVLSGSLVGALFFCLS